MVCDSDPLVLLLSLSLYNMPGLAPYKYLYAHLQTGRIMVWWCPSGSPSVRVSVRPSGSPSASFPHFSSLCFDILSWYFFMWLRFCELQIKFECLQFPLIFVGVMPLLELTILEIKFSALFSYMHIELKFCIWLRFTVLQIKYECCQFPSIFVVIMPFLEVRMLNTQFSALSLTCFDILS